MAVNKRFTSADPSAAKANFKRTGPERPWALSLMPPFPPVALRILSLTTAQEVSGEQLAAMIRCDAAFTAELLRVANSALFGFSRRVGSVAHAVVLLGLDRVKAMAMFVALRASLRTPFNVNTLKRLWTHTVATAMIAERLAKRNRLNTEQAYTAGLLHNLGAMGLMCAYPTDYAFLIETPLDGPPALLEAERALFGIDHCAAGESLATEWELPPEIAAAAKTHHCEAVPGELSIPNVVRVALRLAETSGFAANLEPLSKQGCAEILASAGISPSDTPEELRQMIESQLAFVPVEE